jgi:peptidoglycan/xylan/chitin deacetylase (PgdA/CDA1 family)
VAAGSSGTIYLTFDDGLAYGNQVMNYAACYGVKVTFFEIGELANRDATALRRAIAEGHAVQSHGHFHALYDYGDRSYDWEYNDIAQSIIDIQSITGVRPTYFRPPGGNRSATTYAAAAANGVKLILWADSSGDGANIGTSATCANALAGAFSGATILLHSSKSDTAAAVPCIIEGLAARGYNMQALR